MICPNCGADSVAPRRTRDEPINNVVDSKAFPDENRRRRQCHVCRARFWTIERVETTGPRRRYPRAPYGFGDLAIEDLVG